MRKFNLPVLLPTSVVALSTLVLTACGGTNTNNTTPNSRIELPQAYRLQPDTFATMLEKRVGRIAIMQEDGNVVVMDQTGGNIVPITRDANQPTADNPIQTQLTTAYVMPVWSPDGQNLALVESTSKRSVVSTTVELSPESVTIEHGPGSAIVERTQEGQRLQPVAPGRTVEQRPDMIIIQRGRNTGDLVSSALYVAKADGMRPMRELYLTKNEEIPYIDWAPDGSKISFLTRNVNDESYAINLVDPSGSSKPTALMSGASLFWDWHPSSQFLLAKSGSFDSSGGDELTIVDPQTNATKPVETSNNAMPFLTPSYSPDGQYMALTERADQQFKLILADKEGKPTKSLATFNGIISFAWSPAGAKLAYVVQQSSDSPGGALHMVDANTGEDKVLSQQPVVAFFWSPDGQYIATYSTMQPVEVDPNFAGFNFVPPSATTILLLQTIRVSDKNTRQLFYFEPTEAFRRLTSEFDRYSRAVTIWSPDSRKIVFTLSYGNGMESRDYVLESESTGSLVPRILANGSLAFWSPK